MHKSYDRLKHETYQDRFNIDFIRFFKFRNLFGNLAGSAIGAAIYFIFLKDTFMNNKDIIFPLAVLGAFFFFLIVASIIYRAGNKLKGSLALAGKRGLSSFLCILLVSLIAIVFTDTITLQSTFGEFLHILFSCMIVTSLIAIPFDYGVTLRTS